MSIAPFTQPIVWAGRTLEHDGLPERVGEGRVGRAWADGDEVGLRLYSPPAVSPDAPGGLAAPGREAAYREGLSRFAQLGLSLRPSNSAWVRTRDVVFLSGSACWITDPLPPSLAEVVAARGLPPPDAVMALADSLARALVAHHASSLHLDLCPQSIRLHEGVVRLAHASTDRRGLILPFGLDAGGVRPGYTPLEQTDGAARLPVGPQTDIYAASAILLELLTGRPATSWRGGARAPVQIEGVPEAFASALSKGLATMPADRFATAADFRDALGCAWRPTHSWARGGSSSVEGSDPAPVVTSSAAQPAPHADATAKGPALAAAPIVSSPRRRGGLATTVVVAGVIGATAAGGWYVYAVLPHDYYANRTLTVRPIRDPDAPRMARLPRGTPIEARRAGTAEEVPWLRIESGPYAGGYVSARNVSGDPPPTLAPVAGPDRRAAKRAATAYKSPDRAGAGHGPLKIGETYRIVGAPAAGWLEIEWTGGGVAYVEPYAFEPDRAPSGLAEAPGRPPDIAPKVSPPTAAPLERARTAQTPTPKTSSATSPSGKSPVPSPQRGPARRATATPDPRAAPPQKPPARPSPPPPETADTAPPPSTLPGPVTRPLWTARPSSAAIVRATQAIGPGVFGRVAVNCEVSESGLLSDCNLVSEEPRGQGLTTAASRLLPYYVMAPRDADGQVTKGRRYTLRFTLRATEAPSQPNRK